MTEEQTSVSFSQLPQMIARLEGRVKAAAEILDPASPEHATIMETIQAMMEIINAYAGWVNGMKQEVLKLDKLNKSQAEMIRNKQSLAI